MRVLPQFAPNKLGTKTLFTPVWCELKAMLENLKTHLHGTGSKLCENGVIWKRFLNGLRCKQNPWRCRVDTKSGTFLLCFSAQPPLSQNSNLNRFPCYFLCSIWKVWGLNELLLTCQQILTASCEHTRNLPLFSRFPHQVNAVWSLSNFVLIPRSWQNV